MELPNDGSDVVLYFSWADWSCCCRKTEEAPAVVNRQLQPDASADVFGARISEAAIRRLHDLDREIEILRARIRTEIALMKGGAIS